MANIIVNDLTFCHEGSYENLFSHVSFTLDTDWKLGFIGRNGRGKTTFLRILMGELPYQGSIATPVRFACFPFVLREEQLDWDTLRVAREAIAPYDAWEAEMRVTSQSADTMETYAQVFDRYQAHDGFTIDEQIEKEIGKLGVEGDVLRRPLRTLSPGERAKVLLAALFLRKNNFLLIDEPTNHLDTNGRERMARYLAGKKGFILVSHDRAFLDRAIDHVLSINKATIEVQQGNFSSWWYNKEMKDQYELDENAQLKSQIRRLKQTAHEKAEWSDAVERTKIGTHTYDRGAVGHKAAKMMQRSKAIEQRVHRAVEEKSALLHDIETSEPVKLIPLTYHKERLLEVRDLSIQYGQHGERTVFSGLSFEVLRGERVAITGPNGCGKSSVLKLLMGQPIPHSGEVRLGSGLVISYVSQSTDHLAGPLDDYLLAQGLNITLVRSLLRKLDFSRVQFEQPIERFSEGQKKKLLLAASLSQQAHLYIWDEPLNFIDVLSRMQIESLILEFKPALLFVEHDGVFCERIATQWVRL